MKKIIAGEKKQKTKVTKYRIAVVKHEIEKQNVLNKAVAKHLCRGEDLHLAIVVSHLMEIQASYGDKQQKLDKKRGVKVDPAEMTRLRMETIKQLANIRTYV